MLVLLAQGGTIVAIASWALHLRLLISRDPLTGLAQRRPFSSGSGRVLAREAVRRPSPWRSST
jgi:hypothetical protein